MKKTYDKWSKDELISYIEKLESDLEKNLDKENEAFLIEFPWAGNLGQWHWNYEKNKVIFNDKKVAQLGYDPNTIGDVGFQFFTNKIHPDDYEKVMQNMRDHLTGKINAYEVEYRIEHKDGHYLWYYDRGTVTKRDDNHKPLMIQGIVFDISESKKVEEKLRFLSERDALTNVYNRRAFFDHIDKYIKDKHLKDEPFSLIMFDIDGFKSINDTYGHLVGDDVLKRLTKLIIEDKRSNDKVYRYGGEEFFILLPKTKLNGATKLAIRLLELIRDFKIPKVGHITVSMGVAEFQGKESIDDLIKRVDDLMYDAKASGKDQLKY